MRYVPATPTDIYQSISKGVMLDNAKKEHLEMDGELTREDLRRLAAEYVAKREEERKHIAREVHDELGQILTVLRMNVALLRIRFGDGNPPLMEQIHGITRLVDRAIQGVRNVTTSLRPSVLDMGIVSAVKWLSAEFTRHTAIPCTVDVDCGEMDLDEKRSVMIFRIVQESLTNTARHAEAGSAGIVMTLDGNILRVEVHDSGKGFDPQAHACKESFGLPGMRERALALGGDFNIVSVQGQGTTVSVRVPIPSDLAMS